MVKCFSFFVALLLLQGCAFVVAPVEIVASATATVGTIALEIPPAALGTMMGMP